MRVRSTKNPKKETLVALYKQMKTFRVFEEKIAELYTKGHIGGFCHLYIGQEAVVSGITHNMMQQDSCITSYRDHAHMLAFGASMESVMAELCGRETGCSKGKGGSMHMYKRDRNFFGGNGIVGAQVSLGTGLAFAHKYKKDNGVSVVYFGDGAANQGQVYESFNMASLWELPVVYVLEDNKYAMGTSVARSTLDGSLEKRGEPFYMKTIISDGMDIIDVLEKSKEAIDYSRSESKPVLLCVNTYRYRGHSMSDPATYRTKDEVSEMKKLDPVDCLYNILVDDYGVQDSDLHEIEKDIVSQVSEAENIVLSASEPDVGSLMQDIYSF